MSEELASAAGGPPKPELDRVLGLIRAAQQAVEKPCLEATCDWASQLVALDEAVSALTEDAGAS